VAGRLGLNTISPVIAQGELPARAVVGERIPIFATVFREGHDAVAASIVWRSPDGVEPPFTRMRRYGLEPDRWRAEVVATTTGTSSFVIEAWSDPLATWYHAIEVKADAGQGTTELANDLELGARLFDKVAEHCTDSTGVELARAIAADLRRDTTDLPLRITRALTFEARTLADQFPIRELITRSPRYDVYVDRERALYGAWYEFFPRSINSRIAAQDGDTEYPSRPVRHGTFADATAHLDYVADLGFDVVYLPPIHPIGKVNRKGPNNTLNPGPTDTGSPWAIGSAEGGHDAIHPELGDEKDFAVFVARARELGMEVALDLALQCAPDHPWVTSNPKWFTELPDGSIAYAENPPKKYQDIYPLNFDNDPAGLANEILRITRLWVSRGVNIFRVDNPHTKPLNFWQWLIRTVKAETPEVLFLAEAFTRPAMMHELARIGFTQSYTYFTWRNAAWEIRQYGEQLVASADYMRPNFFPNTPDILNEFLVDGGRAAFSIRAVLASTLSPTYGIYSGFELFENQPVRYGSEEYLDSEKYQLRPRDFAAAERSGDSLAPFIRRLNQIRRAHPSLHRLRNLRFHDSDNDAILAYSKRDPHSGDTILVVCSTDPYHGREGWIHLHMDELGFDYGESIVVSDLVSGGNWEWTRDAFVRLTPYQPAHIFVVRRPT
jgi:starch synthase (maltosyl-transferring)